MEDLLEVTIHIRINRETAQVYWRSDGLTNASREDLAHIYRAFEAILQRCRVETILENRPPPGVH